MSPWKTDCNDHQLRRIGKTLEELGELSAVLARISIQGMDAIDPASGKTNRERLIEEQADVLAQMTCNAVVFGLPQERTEVRARAKIVQMAEWEAHFGSNPL